MKKKRLGKKNCRQYRSAMATDRNMNTNCFLFEFFFLLSFHSLHQRSTLIASMPLFKHTNFQFHLDACLRLLMPDSFISLHVFIYFFLNVSTARPLNVKLCVIKRFGAGALCGNKLINIRSSLNTEQQHRSREKKGQSSGLRK